MAYLGNDPKTAIKSVNKQFVYTATASQTVFTGADDNSNTLNITPYQIVDVYLNGIHLIKTEDYTQSANTITLVVAASLNDELVVVANEAFADADHYLKTETYSQSEVDTTTNNLDSDIGTKAPLNEPTFTGDYIKVPVGATGDRPVSPSNGMIRFNTTTATLEQYAGASNGGWTSMAKPPIISTVSYSGSATAVVPDGGDTITISGVNFTSGVNVRFGNSTWASAVTRTNSTSLSVTTPALTAGDYDITVINGDGMQAILTDGLSVNAAPVFSTSAGSLGSIQVDNAITKITLVASETDGGDIVYTVTTGSLPTGLSLDSSADSAGTISGTPTGYSSETTVNFTITATDDENQTTTRDFSLTVLVGFYSYEISQSARFNDGDGAQLTLSAGSGNRRSWTFSAWIKLGDIRKNSRREIFAGISGNAYDVLMHQNSIDNSYWTILGDSVGDGTWTQTFKTGAEHRDVSGWYHVVWATDTAQSTAADRVKLYVNGVEQTAWTQETNPSQNYDTFLNNSGSTFYLGSGPAGKDDNAHKFDGHLAEVHFVDGTTLTASTFGETKNGVWVPKQVSGVTYGTNGFYLDFANSASLGTDQSGNSNNFTVAGAAANDQVLDSPTNNFPTFNNVHSDIIRYPTFYNANMGYTNSSAQQQMAVLTQATPTTGKWYVEFMCIKGDTGNSQAIGIIPANAKWVAGQDPSYWGGVELRHTGSDMDIYTANGIAAATATASNIGSVSDGDILSIALDLDNDTIQFYKNGTSVNSASALPSNAWVTNSNGQWLFCSNDYVTANGVVVNAGQDSTFGGNKTAQSNADGNGYGDFYYEPPTGFLALCTLNLPDDATFELNQGEKPSSHFDIITYTGDGTSGQSETGLSFQPDFLWIKARNKTEGWSLTDSVRGAGKNLKCNNNDAEETPANHISSFDSNGFTHGSEASVGGSYNYVAYCWKAGGTAVSNTDGSITTSVSANTTAGFSIVSYTGTGTAGNSIGHGLDSTPEVVIVKQRSSTEGWVTYWEGTGASGQTRLDLNGGFYAPGDGTYFWNNQNPTSDVIYLGFDGVTNSSGATYIAYCWHSVEGYSKIGRYWGNGNSDGPFVYTGFRPKFIMFKNTDCSDDGSDDWIVRDTARDDAAFNGNPSGYTLVPNVADGEGDHRSAYPVDILSNGFKIRNTSASYNWNGDQLVFMAFADDPFKYSNAR